MSGAKPPMGLIGMNGRRQTGGGKRGRVRARSRNPRRAPTRMMVGMVKEGERAIGEKGSRIAGV